MSSNGTRLAIALILLWLAFFCFYVAFHPGGVQLDGHPAQNPTDVIKALIQNLGKGSGGGAANGSS